MSETYPTNQPQPPFAAPPYPTPPSGPPRSFYPPPPPPPRSSGLLGCAFGLSFVFNLIAVGLIAVLCMGLLTRSVNMAELSAEAPVPETRFAGKTSAKDKVAIVSLEGVILEGMLGFVHKQIDQAARDKDVKAVVLRINSPGGSITASDDLHHRLKLLADGDPEKKTEKKPLVVSMGSLAASGGYYAAMPAELIFAERTTLTGSIGVYASFPQVEEGAKKLGVGMKTIKAGEIKDSGSMFKEMSPKEEQVWQDMIDHAYDQFLDVVVAGRVGKLTKKDLTATIKVKPVGANNGKPYERYRADGGVWTSDKALELKLIDKIGTLEDAIRFTATDVAKLGEEYKAIRYEKPKLLGDLLFGAKAPQPPSLLNPNHIGNALSPRLWLLAPGAELSGLLSAAAPN